MFLSLAIVCVGVLLGEPVSGNSVTLDRVVLSTEGPNAPACNDGTPFVYYIHTNASSPNWVIYLQGGGNCFDSGSCAARYKEKPSLMSSAGSKATKVVGAGILMGQRSSNPYHYTWNKVYIPYCTSDNWSGNAEKGDTLLNLSFLGSRVVPAVVANLKDRFHLVDSPASVVMLTGSSAGGVGVYPHIDMLDNELLPRSRVVGVVDSGWFLDSPPFLEQNCSDAMACTEQEAFRRGVQVWLPRLNPACAQAMPGLWQCLFGQYVASFITTPLFFFQYQFDLAQLMHDGLGSGGPSSWTPAMLAYAQESARNLTLGIRQTPQHSFFAPACCFHTILYEKVQWLSVAVEGVKLPDAIGWFAAGAVQSVRLDTCATPGCNPTCP